MRCVLIVHPDEARRRDLREAMGGEVEVVEAATREAAVPLLKAKAPNLVVAHHHDFKRFLRDLERHVPGATRAVLCPRGDEALRAALVDVATHGYDFETLDEHAPHAMALLQSRTSARLRPDSALVARFALGNVTMQAAVCEIGSDGLGLELPPSPEASLLLSGVLLERASVSTNGVSLLEPRTWMVRYVRRSPDAPAIRVGVVFYAERLAREVASSVDDEVRVRGLVRRAAARHAWFELRRSDGSMRRRFRGRAVAREDNQIVLRKPAGDHSFPIGQVVHLSFELGGEQLEGLSMIVEADGERVTVTRPEQLRRHHRRSCLRAHLADGIEAYITFHSALDGTRRRRPLLDLHPSGAAFAFSAEREVFPVGLVLTDVVIEVSGQRVCCAATVRSTSPAAPSETEGADVPLARRCGLLLREVTEADAQVLRDVLVRALEPAIAAAADVPFESIWALFEHEKVPYLDHPFGEPSTLSLLRAQQHRLGDGAHGLSKTFVYTQDGETIGHAAALRTHSRTWMSMHLLVRAGFHRAHRVSQSLVTLTFDYGESLPDIEYVRGLWRTKNRWTSRVYGAVSAHLTRPGLSYLATYTPMRRPVAQPFPVPLLAARRAGRVDLEVLLALLRLTEDPIRLASDDLREGEISLESVGRRYRAIGLERSRSFGVVDGRNGEPLGFVMVDQMSPGVFWAEMYNSFRLYLTDPVGPEADEVRHSLIAFALGELMIHRWPVAECHASDLDLPVLERLGFASLGRMMEFGAHRTLIREITAQMMAIFDRLDLRGRADGEVDT